MSTTQIAVREPVLDLVNKAKDNILNRLPEESDKSRFFLGVMTAIQKNPNLLKCVPESVLLAAYEASEVGCDLSPSRALGWIIPYGREAVFQPSYRFFIQSAHKTGDVRSFFAEVVYQGDKFERQFAPKRNLFHAPGDEERTQKGAIGAYALIEYDDGSLDWEYLTREQIERHRGKSKQPDSMKWTTFWEEGWRITAVRVLFKRVPLESRGLEKLSELINRDEGRELLPEQPAGSLVVEGTARVANQATLHFTVGAERTFIRGNCVKIAGQLSRWGGKPDAAGWIIPATSTQLFLELCESRGIEAIDETGSAIPSKEADKCAEVSTAAGGNGATLFNREPGDETD